MRGLGVVTPLMRIGRRNPAPPGPPISGDALKPTAQACLESIDRLTAGCALDLCSDQPAAEIQVGLRDHRAGHRRISMLGQPDTGMQHGLVREPTEPADLFPYVLVDTWYLPLRCHLEVENRR